MRRQITAMALSLALCGSLLSATALAAQTPSGAADAAMAAAGVKDGQTVTQKELYAADPEGTVSFANLEARVRENNLTIRMLEESIASIDVVDYEKMYDELKDGLNAIARSQRDLLQAGLLNSAFETPKPGDLANVPGTSELFTNYVFSNLDASYDSLRETFDDLKDGKIQDDYAAAKRQLENAENQVVMGAETLYMAILEMQNTRASLQRQLDALDRTVEEMELRYQMGQVSALQLQQTKAGRTQLSSGLETLRMNIRNTKAQLEMMIGAEQTGEIALGPVPEVTEKQLESMDLEKDLLTAKERSYELYAAAKKLEEPQENYKDLGRQYNYNEKNMQFRQAKHNWQATQYTYNDTVQSYELKFRTLYAQVQDYKQILEAAKVSLECEKTSCAAAELRYQQGTISANTLLDAKDSLWEAEEKVQIASNDLFSAYNTYCWAVEHGVLN